MKQTVIKFLQNLPVEKYDQFNEAFELYRKSEGKVFSIERDINATGFSERGLANLLYDLQKIHGITDVEKLTVESQMSKVESEEEEEEGVNSEKLEVSGEEEKSVNSEKLEVSGEEGTRPDDSHPGTQIGDATIEPAQANTEAATNAIDVDALVQEKENLEAENEDLQFEKEELEEENEALKEEVEKLKLAPKLDAKQIRVEFPFLNDAACPDEFKILMADKITAWNAYLKLHEYLLKIESGEIEAADYEKADIAKDAVTAFDENQKIYDELNAYQTTGKVLGLHPIFKRLQLTREVETMTSEELVKYKSASAKYFSDNRTSLAKAQKDKNTEKIELITNRVAEREQKLALVNKKLGINPK